MPGGVLRTVEPETGATCCAVADGESVTARERLLLKDRRPIASASVWRSADLANEAEWADDTRSA